MPRTAAPLRVFDPHKPYTVRTRDEGFSGERGGVTFVNGEARFVALSERATEDFQRQREAKLYEMLDLGYSIIEGDLPPRAEASPFADRFDPSNDGADDYDLDAGPGASEFDDDHDLDDEDDE